MNVQIRVLEAIPNGTIQTNIYIIIRPCGEARDGTCETDSCTRQKIKLER